MRVVFSPLTFCVGGAPSKVQSELTDLQSDALLQDYFKKMPLLHFYCTLHEENFANFRRHA